MAEEAEPHLTGPAAAVWLNRLQEEHDNLRAALAFLLASGEASSGAEYEGLRITGALWRFWYVRGCYEEGQEWLLHALRAYPKAPPLLRLKALQGMGNLAYEQGDLARAQTAFEECLALANGLRDPAPIAVALGSLGNVSRAKGDMENARSLREESLALFRQAGDLRGVALSLANLANVIAAQNENAPHQEAATALALHLESLGLFRSLGDSHSVVMVLNNLADMALQGGEGTAAREYLLESMEQARVLESKFGFAHALISLAALGRRAHRYLESARLLGCAFGQLEQMHTILPPHLQMYLDQEYTTLRECLNEALFLPQWTSGRSLPLDQAVRVARELLNDLK